MTGYNELDSDFTAEEAEKENAARGKYFGMISGMVLVVANVMAVGIYFAAKQILGQAPFSRVGITNKKEDGDIFLHIYVYIYIYICVCTISTHFNTTYVIILIPFFNCS